MRHRADGGPGSSSPQETSPVATCGLTQHVRPGSCLAGPIAQPPITSKVKSSSSRRTVLAHTRTLGDQTDHPVSLVDRRCYLCWKQYRWNSLLQVPDANVVQLSLVAETCPSSRCDPLALLVQPTQSSFRTPPALPFASVFVQARRPGSSNVAPVSVTVMGVASVPSVRSVQLLATVAPLISW